MAGSKKYPLCSDKEGTAKLTIANEERNELNTLGEGFSFKGVDKVAVEDVKTMSLDAFVENEGIDHLDVLKLDIEGSELKALQGAQNTIEKYRPAIILGINQNALKASGASLTEVTQMLKKIRYIPYKLRNDPSFALEKVTDLNKARVNVIYCLHESIVPPTLPQPQKIGFADKIRNFFAD